MRISVVTVVMVTLYVTVVHADVQPQKDFSLQRFAGRWFRIGLAYDSAAFAPYRDKLRISMGMITPHANGDVNLTMWDLTPAGCVSKLYKYERTNKPGQFTYLSTRHSMVKDITVVETNYNEYAVVLKHKKFEREYTQVALYGRSRSLRPEIIQKFRDFARSRGFPPESILTPTHAAENCPPTGSGR